MSTVAKIFVVLNLVLAVAFLGAASLFLGYHESYKQRYDDEVKRAAEEKTRLSQQITDTETKLDQANKARADAERNMATSNSEAAALRTGLSAITEAYAVLNASHLKTVATLQVANNTIETSRSLAETYFKAHNTANEKAAAANAEKDAAVKMQHTLQQNLDNALAENKDLQSKLSEQGTRLERAEFRIKEFERRFGTEGVGAGQPSQTAKVLAADNAANVIVISLGSEDGVKVGYRYTVSRGNQYVGTLIITDVSAKQSAGQSMRDLQKSPIQIGDDATSR